MVPDVGRASDGANRVLKKRKCNVDDVFLKHKTRKEPTLVDFANGRPMDTLCVTLHQNTSNDIRRQRRRALTATAQNQHYGGTSFGGDAFRGSSTKTFLGVLDKDTGKMKLFEMSNYCLRPLRQSSHLEALKGGIETHSRSYLEKQEAIAEAFGSKKARQAVSRRKQFQVDTETMSGAVSQAFSKTEVDPEVVEAGWGDGRAEALQSILPPCDREADCVEDVYKLEDIAPDYFLAHLQESAEEFLETRYPDSSFSLLVIELLSVAKEEQDETKRLRLCCLSLYIQHLLFFLRLKGHELNDNKVMKDCPYMIRKHIFRNYTEGKHRRVRSKKAEDQVMCLLLVLAFIVNKYQLSLKVLLQSVPLNRDRLQLMMKLIGATFRTSSQDFILKLPLTQVSQHLPVIGRRTKTKGRR